MESIRLSSSRVEVTQAVGVAIAGVARAGDVIALEGMLGAGKTQLVRGLAVEMGIDPRLVSSPTFMLVQEYEPADPARPVLVHVDAYRLTGDDLATIGWDDPQAFHEGAVVAVEWASRLGDALPADRLDVLLEHAEGGRRVTLTPRGEWVERWDALRRRCP